MSANTRIFDNPNDLQTTIILSRLNEINAQAEPYTYTDILTNAKTYYVAIQSQKTDAELIALLAGAPTADEINTLNAADQASAQLRAEYQNTLTQLQAIQNTANPTNAQVIAAVKYMAGRMELLIKYLARSR